MRVQRAVLSGNCTHGVVGLMLKLKAIPHYFCCMCTRTRFHGFVSRKTVTSTPGVSQMIQHLLKNNFIKPSMNLSQAPSAAFQFVYTLVIDTYLSPYANSRPPDDRVLNAPAVWWLQPLFSIESAADYSVWMCEVAEVGYILRGTHERRRPRLIWAACRTFR